jgi:hypothetical protein
MTFKRTRRAGLAVIPLEKDQNLPFNDRQMYYTELAPYLKLNPILAFRGIANTLLLASTTWEFSSNYSKKRVIRIHLLDG